MVLIFPLRVHKGIDMIKYLKYQYLVFSMDKNVYDMNWAGNISTTNILWSKFVNHNNDKINEATLKLKFNYKLTRPLQNSNLIIFNHFRILNLCLFECSANLSATNDTAFAPQKMAPTD